MGILNKYKYKSTAPGVTERPRRSSRTSATRAMAFSPHYHLEQGWAIPVLWGLIGVTVLPQPELTHLTPIIT
jgi:hypothetical protein